MSKRAALVFVACAVALGAAPLHADEPLPIPVVGLAQSYDVVPNLADAVWTGTGGHWNTTVHVPGATFVKAHIVDLNLKPGDTVTLLSASGRVIERYEGQGPKSMGTFWALSAPGDSVKVSMNFKGEYTGAPFRIDQVIAGNEEFFGGQRPVSAMNIPESVCSPADFEDVVCYQGDADKWATIFASVGVMSVGGNPNSALFCSGSNLRGNNILTNDHCVGTQAACDNTEFVFKFYRTGCNNGAPVTADWQSFRCDQLLANSPFVSCDQGLNDLDFSLFSVLGDPESTYGSVDPDPVPLTDGEAIYIVQHPSGRPHEITHGSGVDVDVDGTVLRYYNTLDTQGGSSGSPIFRESDNKLIGLHHCGGCSTPGLGNRGMLMSDIYPHIAAFLPPDGGIFRDGFESGDFTSWDGQGNSRPQGVEGTN